MTTKSPVSSIWAVAWAKRDSSRSSGGTASIPGRPARKATKAASAGPRQPRLQRASSPSSVIGALIARSFPRAAFPLMGGMARQSAPATPDISVVIPVFDEEGAAPALAREIAQAFKGRGFEMIFVDDASRDGTRAALKALSGEIPQLRVLAHRRNSG